MSHLPFNPHPMFDRTFTLRSQVTGAFFVGAAKRKLKPNEILRCYHDSTNARDPHAIVVKDLTGASVGYIIRQHSASVHVLLSVGVMVMGRMLMGQNILLWTYGPEREGYERVDVTKGVEPLSTE